MSLVKWQNLPKKKIMILFLTVASLCCFQQATAQQIDAKRLGTDSLAIKASRSGMQATIAFIDKHPEIFPVEKLAKGRLLDRQQRMVAWQTWQTFMDHILYLDVSGQFYSSAYLGAKDKPEKASMFFYAFASFLAEYRYAMAFIDRMEKNPSMHVMLNEPVPELGLEKDTYARLKFRFLNILRGAEFARLNVLYEIYKNDGANPFAKGMAEDIATIWQAGQGSGPVLTFQNALRIVGDLGFTAWFPVQKEISQIMGNIKVWRQGKNLITDRQIEILGPMLEPGDILLERREWYASNVGIPGFWPHAALYIGSAAQRNHFFSGPEIASWLKEQGSEDGTFDGLFKNRYPQEYALAITRQEGHEPRVLEAIGEGVSFTTLEHSAAADSLAVLRPRLSLKAKALAVLRAIHYSGRPYDFNFDFLTDSELVCSELIYKAYEPGQETAGLSLPLSDLMGRKIVSPNDIARIFANEYGGPDEQFQLVGFLDGNERSERALDSGVDNFIASWKRPKWHIWVQNLNLETKEQAKKWQE